MAVVAELRGKLDGYQTAAGSRYVDAEDPLTASIFESIEVMDRELALGRVLQEATGDVFSPKELAEAEFHYWMRDVKAFGDQTEPDLVVTVGNTLFLLEAKYRSGLGQADKEGKGQLKREYEGGIALMHKKGLSQYRLVCVVGDASVLDEIRRFQREIGDRVHCLQWQEIHRVMAEAEELPGVDWRDLILATRCKELLERRRMASFRGFRHLQIYKDAQGFHDEVFNFATSLLHRLDSEGIVGAVHEFRIERDGGQRSLRPGMVDSWGPSYFALPVQRQSERASKIRKVGGRRATFCRVDQFAFFMVDVDRGRFIVGKATAPRDTWKISTFWHDFFQRLKRQSAELDRATLTVGETQFQLTLNDRDPETPDLLELVRSTIVGYLS
jgi:hypothetical protein